MKHILSAHKEIKGRWECPCGFTTKAATFVSARNRHFTKCPQSGIMRLGATSLSKKKDPPAGMYVFRCKNPGCGHWSQWKSNVSNHENKCKLGVASATANDIGDTVTTSDTSKLKNPPNNGTIGVASATTTVAKRSESASESDDDLCDILTSNIIAGGRRSRSSRATTNHNVDYIYDFDDSGKDDSGEDDSSEDESSEDESSEDEIDTNNTWV